MNENNDSPVDCLITLRILVSDWYLLTPEMKSIERLRLIKGFDKTKHSRVKVDNFIKKARIAKRNPLLSATARIKSVIYPEMTAMKNTETTEIMSSTKMIA